MKKLSKPLLKKYNRLLTIKTKDWFWYCYLKAKGMDVEFEGKPY